MGDRQKHYRAGVWAERIAGVYLSCKGYRILERRYKSPVGEIDLIAKRAGRIGFVEVKYRQSLEQAAFSITEFQKTRIVQAAKFWLSQNSQETYEELSFDAVLFAPWRWPQHIQNAFEERSGWRVP